MMNRFFEGDPTPSQAELWRRYTDAAKKLNAWDKRPEEVRRLFGAWFDSLDIPTYDTP